MQTENSDPRLPENLGERGALNAEVLEEFAQSMAENMIQSFLKLEPKLTSSSKNLKMLAEELASAVMENALREVCIPGSVEDQIGGSESSGVKNDCEEAKNMSFVDKSGEDEDLVDTEMDQVKEIHTSRVAQSYHPPLSHSGLLVVGSLDYPDAPPTTPLIPELERSRHSFARQLKGGLAKVFLPSPPPPTPKDKEDKSNSDPQAELMEHLMHSLSPHELARDSLEAGALQGASAEAFAEDLSCDIINWVFNLNKRRQITDESNLKLLTNQLAETIITSSLDKAKTSL
ncbi:uncharacterized protein si:dkey-171c9.3 [Kryptolebias marmoratus]|uniref:uncharacterized protein si:dkey-171c9.3 n=1 Tax=Kryptolebias marmoratus TaxID=37003 RepID=UPI0007F89512|nr:uncharacterized protein si:dkey-171c9.3 [Kryptolebias marmoratus]